MQFSKEHLFWVRKPQRASIGDDQIIIHTEPHTDLWQRTYYGFRNDNAPVLQMKTAEPFFTFTVKTSFIYKTMYDQCGIALYLDSENWLKASIEYENEAYQRLGSVVTNHGYSDWATTDWATTDIPADVYSMWYRLSRRQSDYRIECSDDGQTFHQMRILHLHEGAGEISFGLYACSPGDSSFQATFTHMNISECVWTLHE